MVLKICKIIAICGFVTALHVKRTKFVFGRGFAPDPAGGAHSAPPDPLAGLKGPTSKGREGEEKGRGQERNEKGEKGRGGTGLLFANSWFRH